MRLPFLISTQNVQVLLFFRLPLPSIASINAIARLSWHCHSPCFILPFLRFSIRSPSRSFICLFFAFVSPLSRRACPEWLVPFPRLAVLPPFYSLVSLSLCLTVPSFICSFAFLSFAYQTVSGPNGFCLFLSPLLFDTFKFYPQILAFVLRFSWWHLLFLDPGNDCNTLTG